MLKNLFLVVAVIFIIAVAFLGVREYLYSQKSAISRSNLWSAYNDFFSEEICLEANSKPKFINRQTRKSYVLECETSLNPVDSIYLYSEKLRKNNFTILFNGEGPDGIMNVRGCNRGIIFAVYAGKVDAKKIVERRVLWASAEYRRSPEECKLATK